MIALYSVGPLIEKYYGKLRYLIIYLGSGILGSLFAAVLSNRPGIGASGAIFGLFGSLLFFGLKYRATLDGFLRSSVIPIILANLFLGFLIPNVGVYAHIGGLIGGLLFSYLVGVREKEKIKDRINGLIMLIILTIALSYMLITK